MEVQGLNHWASREIPQNCYCDKHKDPQRATSRCCLRELKFRTGTENHPEHASYNSAQRVRVQTQQRRETDELSVVEGSPERLWRRKTSCRITVKVEGEHSGGRKPPQGQRCEGGAETGLCPTGNTWARELMKDLAGAGQDQNVGWKLHEVTLPPSVVTWINWELNRESFRSQIPDTLYDPATLRNQTNFNSPKCIKKTEYRRIDAFEVKNWLIGKDPDAGKDSRREEKGTTEDEMVGWHHQLNGHEFGQTPGESEGQGKPGVLQPIGSPRVGHDLVTEQQQSKSQISISKVPRNTKHSKKDNRSELAP